MTPDRKTIRSVLLRIGREFLHHPTAPFREDKVRGYVLDFCARHKIFARTDEAGNIVASVKGSRTARRLAFVAHLDHPGFIIEQDSVRGRTTALFYGGWDPNTFKAAPIRIFTKDGSVSAQATRWTLVPGKNARRAVLEVAGDVARGDLAMWDFKPLTVRGTILYSRSCDDGIGCILILALMELHRKESAAFSAVFTSAEEPGLHGAKHLCTAGTLPSTTVPISVESSRELPHANWRRGDSQGRRFGDDLCTRYNIIHG